MQRYFLYMHTGSLNLGCEAIVRSTCKILNNNNIVLFSSNLQEDMDKKINMICEVKKYNEFTRYSFEHIIGTILRRVFGSMYYYYKNMISSCDSDVVALSIGGDMYCYNGCPPLLAKTNYMLKKRGGQTVLWGCSIEPELLNDYKIVKDLKRYDLIIARESITYSALINTGISMNTYLFPDPAFTLETVNLPLPSGFEEYKTVGVNISPLIMNYEKGGDITYQTYFKLVEYLINHTNMQVALIPHVTTEDNNDLQPLRSLYKDFHGSGRIVLLEDKYNCKEIKGFISRCRFFVGARTHATIAAYSTCVPTLVVGYSVKARGIARDIFGSEENMVIPVQSLEHEEDLVNAFKYIQENEETIRKHLRDFMPSYIEKAWLSGEEVKKLMEK